MDPKTIVRAGYDAVSHAYRGAALDWDDACTLQYAHWLRELTSRIPAHSAVLDLGCGNGIPAATLLADAGFAVSGVDISPVQIARAQRTLPHARFICADMTELTFPAHTFAAIVALYAIIHIPLAEQPALFAKLYAWLQPGGYLLATVGAEAWTGTEDAWLGVAGATMYWSHADAATYEEWCRAQGFRLCWTRFIAEEDGGHTLLLAHKPAHYCPTLRAPACACVDQN